MLLSAYLYGWLFAMIGVLGAAAPASDVPRPGPLTRGFVAMLAGALWPVVAVGLVEIALIWASASTTRAFDARRSRHAWEQRDKTLAA